jgi:hypothetical protein
MSENPPAAHEDLTIAETLETMRVSGDHRPGDECFRDETGAIHWVSKTRLHQFLKDHGAEHPSNYRSANGVPWTDCLFELSNPIQP